MLSRSRGGVQAFGSKPDFCAKFVVGDGEKKNWKTGHQFESVQTVPKLQPNNSEFGGALWF